MPLNRVRECLDCGLHLSLPALPVGANAVCPRCDKVVERGRGDPTALPLALSVTGLVLLAIALTSDLMDVAKSGLQRTATLLTGPDGLRQDGLWELSVVVIYTTIAGPLIQLAGMTVVLGAVARGRPPAGIAPLFAWVRFLRPWAMVEVYLVGVFVAYTKLQTLVSIQVGVGLVALVVLMVVMVAADWALDPEAVWARLGRPAAAEAGGRRGIGCSSCGVVSQGAAACPRCRSRLHARKPDSVARTWALAIAALILYVPANVYPVLTYVELGSGQPSTILGGARELLEGGQWPLALIVFVASIAVPVLKLAGLLLMLLTTRPGVAGRLRDRTRLYRIVVAIGRWSMIDIFMESILVALVRFGGVVTILPGPGALAFAGVVILTMLAAESFDPRLMWDAAAARPASAPVEREA